jgi:hypothetical protein
VSSGAGLVRVVLLKGETKVAPCDAGQEMPNWYEGHDARVATASRLSGQRDPILPKPVTHRLDVRDNTWEDGNSEVCR